MISAVAVPQKLDSMALSDSDAARSCDVDSTAAQKGNSENFRHVVSVIQVIKGLSLQEFAEGQIDASLAAGPTIRLEDGG